jgi:Ser/Thr protein kinase RdoA (MazF antagonist)/guanylate kinase
MRFLNILFICVASLGFSNTKTDPIFVSENFSASILMSAGVANEVYLVPSSSSELHILKIFNRKSLEDLERSESLLQLVRNAGINVPQSIIPPTKIGAKIISVLSFIDGHHIDDSRLPDVAKLMATLHRIEVEEIPAPSLKNYFCLFNRCKNWKYCYELKKIYDSLDLSYRDDLPRGLIHGDFSYTNLIVDQKNNLALLDFDHLRNDILLTDLARCHLFYGFDKDGQIKENTIRTFVSAYHQIRPLKAIELDAFFIHMKLCLLDVALEMYDHMYVKHDLAIERVCENPFNVCLNPDLIAKEIISIKDRSSLVLDNQTFPIFFFGLSGVGKTTLIHLLTESSDLFYIPIFTVTRPPRNDDDSRYFEYLSDDEFVNLIDQGKFYVWMNQEGTYYGYRSDKLTDPNRYPLLNASAYGIDAISHLKGIKVLIEGDAQRGLVLRQNSQVARTREKVNRLAQEKFFSQSDFLNQMNIVFNNQFGNPSESARQLKLKILQEIDRAN